MLISRCAWHPRYYGHSKLLGVSHWRGLGIDFTDGICPKCAARVRIALQRRAVGNPPPIQHAGGMSEVIVVALAVLTGLVLIARPANEGSTRLERVDLLTAVASEPPSPAAVVARPARARRPTTLLAATVLLGPAQSVERIQSP